MEPVKKKKSKPNWKAIKAKAKMNKEKLNLSAYERKETYSLYDIFSRIDEEFAEYDGDKISMKSARYQLFAKNHVCVVCGIEGQFFAKERQHGNKRYHFNLYAVDSDGKEILMTKDHIVPRSKGGEDNISNYQTMCAPCNEKKGNKHES